MTNKFYKETFMASTHQPSTQPTEQPEALWTGPTALFTHFVTCWMENQQASDVLLSAYKIQYPNIPAVKCATAVEEHMIRGKGYAAEITPGVLNIFSKRKKPLPLPQERCDQKITSLRELAQIWCKSSQIKHMSDLDIFKQAQHPFQAALIVLAADPDLHPVIQPFYNACLENDFNVSVISRHSGENNLIIRSPETISNFVRRFVTHLNLFLKHDTLEHVCEETPKSQLDQHIEYDRVMAAEKTM